MYTNVMFFCDCIAVDKSGELMTSQTVIVSIKVHLYLTITYSKDFRLMTSQC